MSTDCEKDCRNAISLSVIVPVYAVENYIEQCARSLFEQTLRSIEYIFVDDCSPDNSINILLKIIEDYPDRKSQVRIIHHHKNYGLAQARMTGFKNANGAYMTSIDSDDWVDLTTFETLIEKASRADSDVVVYNIISQERCGDTHIEVNYLENSNDPLSDLFLGKVAPIIPTCIFRRFFIDDNLLNLPAANMAEDLVFSTFLCYYAKDISYVNKPFYHYRYNSQSISKSIGLSATIKRFKDIMQNTNQVIAFLEEKSLQNKYQNEILNLKHIVKYTIWSAVYDNDAYKLWKETYPEIVSKIITHKYYTTRTRLLYLLTEIGLYPLYLKVKKVTQFIHHSLVK